MYPAVTLAKCQCRLKLASRRHKSGSSTGALIASYWLFTAANVVGAVPHAVLQSNLRSQTAVAGPGTLQSNSSGLIAVDGTPNSTTGSIATLAWKPVEVLELGGPVVAAKAKIVGTALIQGMTGSVLKIGEGNLVGALEEARAAASHAQEANYLVDIETSLSAWTSVGILVVVGTVIGCWLFEYYLSRREDQTARRDEQTVYENRRYCEALNFARYLMSWYVILNNFYQPGEQTRRMGSAWIIFARWGATAIPWFFVLSGFSHTYALFVSSAEKPEDWFLFMIKKVAKWYPLYAMSLTWCALKSWSIDAEDWSHYLAKMLLIEGIIWEKTTFPFLLGDWWLCFLMVYLLVAYPMYHVLSTCNKTVMWTLFTIAFFMCIPFSVMEWFFTSFSLLKLVEFYVSFVFGQALAAWFVRNCMDLKQGAPSSEPAQPVYVMKGRYEIPIMVRFGATFTYLLLGICFFWFSPYDKLPVIRHPVLPLLEKGALLPIFGLMIAGLACEYDPIAKVFARAPLRWLDKFAFANFVLQVPIHNTIRDWTGWVGFTWTFVGILFGASIVAHFLIERPWQRFLSMTSLHYSHKNA